MHRAWTIPLLAVAGAVALAFFQHPLLGRTPADPVLVTLEHPAQLSPAPGAAPMAVLMAGARLQLLEQRDGWSRVSLEGWIPDGDGAAGGSPAAAPGSEPPGQPAAAAPSVPSASPAPAAVSGEALLHGVIFVTGDKGRTLPGTGVVVRLLHASGQVLADLQGHRRDCAARQAELSARAAELKQQAGRVLRTTDNTTHAFDESDRLKQERDSVRRRLAGEARACREKEEDLLEAHAVRRAIAAEGGRYAFDDVPAGSYTVQATLEAEGKRHLWMVPIEITPRSPLSLDLTVANREAVEAIPQAP